MNDTDLKGTVSKLIPLDHVQMRRSIYISVLLALVLPPFLGGSIMGLVGFYPMPEFYLVFFSYGGAYILAMVFTSLALVPRAWRFIFNLTQQDVVQASSTAQYTLVYLPWLLLGFITLYSIGGALSADYSLASLGIRSYTFREHLYIQFGLIPVVLITVFPIFFFFIDRLGRYLAPRGISVTAIPLWVKLTMLGIVSPLLIDSMLIGYYYNRTGFFEMETLVLWLSLMALAIGGTWMVRRSLYQGLAPLENFTGIHSGLWSTYHATSLTPLSLDELGVLTTRLARLMAKQIELNENLRSAESLANAVIDHAGGLVLLLNQKGQIIRFNHACEKLTGYTFDEVQGKHPWDILLPAEEAEKVHVEAFDSLATNPEKLAGEYTNYVLDRNGERHLVEWSNTLLLDANGQMEYMVSLGNDITERSEYENKLRRLNETLELRVSQRTAAMALARDLAESANAAKYELFSRMSHELRTPLNAILGFGQLLENSEPKLSEQQAGNVHDLLQAGYHLFDVVKEILDLNNIESGKLDLNPVSISLPVVLDACIRQVQTLAANNKIRITRISNDPYSVQGDLMRLRDVLVNLLSNAIKYNKEGGEVHVSYMPSAGQRVVIKVRDTGRGIPPEFMPRLFKPFERCETGYEGVEGTGIGLALAKKLVEAMGGEIGVESVQGQGSTFWFELPLAETP